MKLRNTSEKWGMIGQSLHWLIAILIIALWLVAEVMMGMLPPTDPALGTPSNTFLDMSKWELYGLHKEVGVLVLLLAVARVLWRFTSITPTHGDNMNMLEKLLANGVHLALYAVMFAMPISGYIMSMAGGHGILFFGFPLPDLIGANPELGKTARWIHHEAFELFWMILALHVAGAFYHYYVKKDGVLQRMLPTRD
ncbi:MAG: cytochrome b [Alphaproteobacteria bacterium]